MFTAKNLSLLYHVVGSLPFLLKSADMVQELWPGIKTETCPRRSQQCTETLEFVVGKVYLQVICAVSFMYACLVFFGTETKGLVAAMACMVGVMSKHVIVDNLVPPPPVMAMTAAVIGTIALKPAWGERAFIGYMLVNAATFTLQPLMVLTDTFPEVKLGSEAFRLGAFLFEVIAYFCVASAVVVATSDKVLGLAYSSQIGLAVLGKHVLVDKSGPPLPLVCLFVATTLKAWHEVGWSNPKAAVIEAVKQGPMKLHAVVALGFVAYFALESVNLPLPVVGLAAIDASYSYSGSTALLTSCAAILLAVVVYFEYFGQMEVKVFTAYHYALSTSFFLHAFQPSTSTVGALWFGVPHLFTAAGEVPHLFTAWTVYLYHTAATKTA